jgi:choline dehydrogenase-like flavoprotein
LRQRLARGCRPRCRLPDGASWDEEPPASGVDGPRSARRRAAPRLSSVPPRAELPERVDFLIIGSGPGGAVAAYRLAELCPAASIVVIERGPRFSPVTDFSDDEVDMVSKLYKDGGLQQTRGPVMTLLQAECVGGGSLVNNGVCARIPDAVLARWRSDFGLESVTRELDAEYARIAAEIGIRPIAQGAVNQRVLERFSAGTSRLAEELEPPLTLSINASFAQGPGNGTWVTATCERPRHCRPTWRGRKR